MNTVLVQAGLPVYRVHTSNPSVPNHLAASATAFAFVHALSLLVTAGQWTGPPLGGPRSHSFLGPGARFAQRSQARQSARLLNIEIGESGAHEIARRSRGTPRIANNLLRRVRDYAQVRGDGRISAPIADQALAMLEIDENGLDEMDKRILEAVIVKFGGGPVGVSSLAVAVGEEPDTLEEVYEPYLIMEGYLKRTPQGRVATELSYKKLGLKPVAGNQANLL